MNDFDYTDLRFVFDQDIYMLPDNQLVLKGKVIGVCLRSGRPTAPDDILPALVNLAMEGVQARSRVDSGCSSA